MTGAVALLLLAVALLLVIALAALAAFAQLLQEVLPWRPWFFLVGAAVAACFGYGFVAWLGLVAFLLTVS